MTGPKPLLAITLGNLSVVSLKPTAAQDIYQADLPEDETETPNISTQEPKQFLNDESATVVDVRTFAEYSISHIPGAVNVSAETPTWPRFSMVTSTTRAATCGLRCGPPGGWRAQRW